MSRADVISIAALVVAVLSLGLHLRSPGVPHPPAVEHPPCPLADYLPDELPEGGSVAMVTSQGLLLFVDPGFGGAGYTAIGPGQITVGRSRSALKIDSEHVVTLDSQGRVSTWPGH